VKLVLRTIDGFTPQQRFYLAFAEIWCENDREEALRLQVNTKPHAPAKTASSRGPELIGFQKAFSCMRASPW